MKKAYFGLKNLLEKTEHDVAKGKLCLAVEDFKEALAFDPNQSAHNVHLYLGLCKPLVKLGRGKDALDSCAEALNIDGELVEAILVEPFFAILVVLLRNCMELENPLLCI
uniref:Uncharacterized protein n=1 Tax=Ananas comosus var. bracteatus TaxID=296719 RepID=A0A6V7Q6W1_ANACO|nr:unnamed protein product [Ananas comosus var. bracteatus]